MPKLMINGAWRGDVADTPELRACRIAHGRFHHPVERSEAAEPGRFHLYVSYACPFAHRAILARTLLGLEDHVGMSVLHPRWNTPDGWVFGAGLLSTADGGGNGWTHLHQAYGASDPAYTGKVTVPVLWDRTRRSIVGNESAEIVRLFNDAFAPPGTPDLYPAAMRPEIETRNAAIGQDLAAGVYAVAGAADQAEYDGGIRRVFALLDKLEDQLGDGRAFLHGPALTASDLFLFTPLVRFDAVYNPLFRVSLRRLVDYPRLSSWARRVHAVPGVAETVRFDHILRHYHDGDWAVANRAGIVPALPAVDYRVSPVSPAWAATPPWPPSSAPIPHTCASAQPG